jgi:cytochrome c biogenesis protein CcmG/thiol:disulfide interchange protein DsbE
MRRLLFILPLATLAIMAGFFAWSLSSGRDPASIGSALVGRAAPDKTLIVEGKPTLLNFFASWCAPCLVEHPLFLRLKEREGAVIVGVAWKNKREEAEAWLQRLGNPYARVEFDLDGRRALDWGLSGVPETYLVDAKGIVRLHFRRAIGEQDLPAILPLLKGAR